MARGRRQVGDGLVGCDGRRHAAPQPRQGLDAGRRRDGLLHVLEAIRLQIHQERCGRSLVEGAVEVEAQRREGPHRLAHRGHAAGQDARVLGAALELQAPEPDLDELARLGGGDLGLRDAHEGIDRHVERRRRDQEAHGRASERLVGEPGRRRAAVRPGQGIHAGGRDGRAEGPSDARARRRWPEPSIDGAGIRQVDPSQRLEQSVRVVGPAGPQTGFRRAIGRVPIERHLAQPRQSGVCAQRQQPKPDDRPARAAAVARLVRSGTSSARSRRSRCASGQPRQRQAERPAAPRRPATGARCPPGPR